MNTIKRVLDTSKIILLIFGIFICFNVSCSNEGVGETPSDNPNSNEETKHDDAIDTNDKTKIPHVLTAGYYADFIPLTFSNFQNIRNDIDDFSHFSIHFSKRSNIDPNGHSDHRQFFDVQAGFGGQSRLWSSLELFDGGTFLNIKDVTPKEGIGYPRSFLPADIDLIFDYLEVNHDYFFNAEEYEGLEIPYKAKGAVIGQGNIKFSVIFRQPEEGEDTLAISKCMDDPNPIMQGLIDIFEEHFIDEFEQGL